MFCEWMVNDDYTANCIMEYRYFRVSVFFKRNMVLKRVNVKYLFVYFLFFILILRISSLVTGEDMRFPPWAIFIRCCPVLISSWNGYTFVTRITKWKVKMFNVNICWFVILCSYSIPHADSLIKYLWRWFGL